MPLEKSSRAELLGGMRHVRERVDRVGRRGPVSLGIGRQFWRKDELT